MPMLMRRATRPARTYSRRGSAVGPGPRGDQVLVKITALLTEPVGAVVFLTVSGPLVAVDGTVAMSWAGDEDVSTTLVAATPLNLTVELALNPTPLMVTRVPVGPLGR